MLKIPTHELRLLRTLAKAHCRIRRRSTRLMLIVRTDGDDLLLQIRWQDYAIERRLTGAADEERPELALVLSLDVIADALKPRRGDVRIAVQGDVVALSWTDRGVERRLRLPLEVPSDNQAVPPRPTECTAMPASFREGWVIATACSNPDSVRYALGCVQLDGRGNMDGTGRLAATDGVQAFVQSGIDLPWPEEVLVPASLPLGHRQLPSGPVEIGRVVVPANGERSTDRTSRSSNPPKSDHVVTLVAGYTFWSPVQAGRFPDIDRVVPMATTNPPATRLALDRTDAILLAESIEGLPGGMDDPVTLELTERIRVSAESGEERSAISLSRSRTLGECRRVTMRRGFLRRAAALGFDEIELHGRGRPAVCRGSTGRTYIWMVLSDATVAPPVEAADAKGRFTSGGASVVST